MHKLPCLATSLVYLSFVPTFVFPSPGLLFTSFACYFIYLFVLRPGKHLGYARARASHHPFNCNLPVVLNVKCSQCPHSLPTYSIRHERVLLFYFCLSFGFALFHVSTSDPNPRCVCHCLDLRRSLGRNRRGSITRHHLLDVIICHVLDFCRACGTGQWRRLDSV